MIKDFRDFRNLGSLLLATSHFVHAVNDEDIREHSEVSLLYL
jgi:predicted transcriptional regulator